MCCTVTVGKSNISPDLETRVAISSPASAIPAHIHATGEHAVTGTSESVIFIKAESRTAPESSIALAAVEDWIIACTTRSQTQACNSYCPALLMHRVLETKNAAISSLFEPLALTQSRQRPICFFLNSSTHCRNSSLKFIPLN